MELASIGAVLIASQSLCVSFDFSQMQQPFLQKLFALFRFFLVNPCSLESPQCSSSLLSHVYKWQNMDSDLHLYCHSYRSNQGSSIVLQDVCSVVKCGHGIKLRLGKQDNLSAPTRYPYRNFDECHLTTFNCNSLEWLEDVSKMGFDETASFQNCK